MGDKAKEPTAWARLFRRRFALAGITITKESNLTSSGTNVSRLAAHGNGSRGGRPARPTLRSPEPSGGDDSPMKEEPSRWVRSCGCPSPSRSRRYPVLPGMAGGRRPVHPRDWYSALSGAGGHGYLLSGLSPSIAVLINGARFVHPPPWSCRHVQPQERPNPRPCRAVSGDYVLSFGDPSALPFLSHRDVSI
jgi:hypothetical protein